MRVGLQRVAIAIAIVAVSISAAWGWYHVSVQPGAALVRALFQAGPAVHAGSGISLHPENINEVTGIKIPPANPGEPAASVDVYTPVDADGLPVVFWIHGGGFIANSAADIAGYARVLASNGYVVVALDYSLAPEHKYPVPVAQADAALAWVVDTIDKHGGDPSRIVLGGDSAGAQIASQVAATQTDADFATTVGVSGSAEGRIDGVIVFCGLYDMTTVADTRFPMLRTFLWSYTGTRNWTEYPRITELSTTTTASSHYPPTFIAVGDADPFAPQSTQLAQALADRGVDVTTHLWTDEGLQHEYQFDFRLPQAVETLDATLEFLHRVTS